ncbi:Cof subfamily protein (haloacid dehalogenase superfamily) [Streptococcus rupicaprae]|uniref:Cof subfamily protein (Haloacid dehalogenase superfamily) n=1 Tax=Streptococcus rupicaprae TaxID=759619 RepID=A0ABV2FHA6_9STRE
MAIKVIASDLDGTLLDASGNIDRERFVKVLDELDRRGIRFVAATGNSMNRIEMIFDGFTDRISYVAENGAYVLDQNEVIAHKMIAHSDSLAFLDYFRDKWEDYRITVTYEDAIYMVSDQFGVDAFSRIAPEQMALFQSRIRKIDDFAQLPESTIMKLGMILPEAECDAIMTDFNHHFSGNLIATTSGYGAVDIMPKGIHKAWGLEQLLSRWGVAASEVMAFGDGGNDYEMLQLAQYSYAMDNAPDFVKAAAKHVAPNHDEHGVLTIIEQFLKGEIHDDGGEVI